MTHPIGDNPPPSTGVQKIPNEKGSSLPASSADKTLPPTNFAIFKKVLKRGLAIAFLPFVMGYKIVSKSMAEKRFIQDQVLPRIEKAIEEAEKNRLLKTKPLLVGSFKVDSIDLTKIQGKSTHEILTETLVEMKRKNHEEIDVYREKIKGYIHADFSVPDEKGNPSPLDGPTKKMFMSIEQHALKKIKLHNEMSDKEGRPKATKKEELAIVQSCIEEERKNLLKLIQEAKKSNFEAENNEKIHSFEKRIGLLQDYTDAIKTYSSLKVFETKIESQLEQCELTPVKNFFKTLGVTLAAFYLGLMWMPLIPVFALIGISNAAVVAGTGRDLSGRKFAELEKQNQLAALKAAQTNEPIFPAALPEAKITPLISTRIPFKEHLSDESALLRQQEELREQELNKIIEHLDISFKELDEQHELDKIIQRLDDIEVQGKDRAEKKTSQDPYQFIDELIKKIDSGKPSP